MCIVQMGYNCTTYNVLTVRVWFDTWEVVYNPVGASLDGLLKSSPVKSQGQNPKGQNPPNPNLTQSLTLTLDWCH